jgi:hypothetical protein
MTTDWFPGTRTPMIQQVFQPVLYVTVAWGAGRCLLRWPRLMACTRFAGACLLCILAGLLRLEYNRGEVRITAGYKSALVALLQQPGLVACPVKNVVILFPDTESLPFYSSLTARGYVQTHPQFGKRNLAFVTKASRCQQAIGYREVIFQADGRGLLMRCGLDVDRLTQVPYRDVAFFRCTGSALQELPALSPADLVGLDAGIEGAGGIIPGYRWYAYLADMGKPVP